MLSYRHSFHAGNKADIFKHSCLFAFLLLYTKKEKSFTAFDLNAGAGIYNLLSDNSLKTGEAKAGILNLLNLYEKDVLPKPIPPALKMYLDFSKKNYEAEQIYAGSPEIIRVFLRQEDSLILSELQSCEFEKLKAVYKEHKNIHLHKRDCYEVLPALSPPKPNRGFAFFDPSYEVLSDYTSIASAIKKALKKWHTGVFIVWYPLLKRKKEEEKKLKDKLLSLGSCESFYAETLNKCVPDEKLIGGEKYGLQGSGILIVNPPWGLKSDILELTKFINSLDF